MKDFNSHPQYPGFNYEISGQYNFHLDDENKIIRILQNNSGEAYCGYIDIIEIPLKDIPKIINWLEDSLKED